MPISSPMNPQKMQSSLTLRTLLSRFGVPLLNSLLALRFFCRAAPVLKDAIDSGKINLTAIVNTHQ